LYNTVGTVAYQLVISGKSLQ